MTLLLSRAPLGAFALAAALTLAAGAARAEITDAQREACTPDALRLCQATIPDIEKTTACMKAHVSQLSPRCKVAFAEATGGGKGERRAPRRGAVAPPPPPATESAGVDLGLGAPFAFPGAETYAAEIRGYCRDGLIDPYTCRNTLATLHGGTE